MVLAVISVLILCMPSIASAEDSFTNHIDLFQVLAKNNSGHTHLMDLGYHFTVFNFKRFQLVGAGVLSRYRRIRIWH